MEELLRFTRAMVALQLYTAQAAAARVDAPTLRPELLLADAGLNAREIAVLLGKTPAAVSKAVTRGRSARRGRSDPNERILNEGLVEHA